MRPKLLQLVTATASIAALTSASEVRAETVWQLLNPNNDETFQCDSVPQDLDTGSGVSPQNGSEGSLIIGTNTDDDLPRRMRTDAGYANDLGDEGIRNSCQSVTIEYNVESGAGYTDCQVTWVRNGVEISMLKHDGVLLDDPDPRMFGSEYATSTFVRRVPGSVLAADNPHRLQLIADQPLFGDGFFTQDEISVSCTNPVTAMAGAAGGGGGGVDGGETEKGEDGGTKSQRYVFNGEFGMDPDSGGGLWQLHDPL